MKNRLRWLGRQGIQALIVSVAIIAGSLLLGALTNATVGSCGVSIGIVLGLMSVLGPKDENASAQSENELA